MKSDRGPLASSRAFELLLDTLREAAQGYLAADRAGADPGDAVEGYRYVLHLLSGGIDFYLECDPDRPAFVRMVSPMRKLGGDNPDAIYHFARIRGDRTYRVRGRRGSECYLSFTVHGRAEDGRLGMAAEPVLADVNDRRIEFAGDGTYELVLSPQPHPGNWIRLEPAAASLIVRHYYESELCAAADPELKIDLSIEVEGGTPGRSERDDAGMASRIRDVAAFVRGATLELIDMTSLPVPFVSRTPNELPQPSGFGASGQAAWGAVDIAYAMAPFRIAPDEALVMTGRLPECAFANVVLWNRHMQTFEYRDRRVSLNRRQMVLEADGSYRIVIAHRDPGVPNWLDTDGHCEGTIFWRFLLPAEQPPRPECRLVRLAELRT